jgi:hypothetical protein
MVHTAITTTWIRYLRLCFTNPRIRDSVSQTGSPRDFRGYAEYLNDWPLIEYTLRYIKVHHDLCGRNKEVSQLIITLVQQLADNQASYFIGSFIVFRFGQNYGTEILMNEHQGSSENIKYSTLNAAAEPELPQVVKVLLLTCTQEDHHTERKTPLIISAQRGLAGATRRLLDRNVDMDAKDNLGRTALHHAAENGDEAIIRLLIEQGAQRVILDSYNETALHIAVKKS